MLNLTNLITVIFFINGIHFNYSAIVTITIHITWLCIFVLHLRLFLRGVIAIIDIKRNIIVLIVNTFVFWRLIFTFVRRWVLQHNIIVLQKECDEYGNEHEHHAYREKDCSTRFHAMESGR